MLKKKGIHSSLELVSCILILAAIYTGHSLILPDIPTHQAAFLQLIFFQCFLKHLLNALPLHRSLLTVSTWGVRLLFWIFWRCYREIFFSCEFGCLSFVKHKPWAVCFLFVKWKSLRVLWATIRRISKNISLPDSV